MNYGNQKWIHFVFICLFIYSFAVCVWVGGRTHANVHRDQRATCRNCFLLSTRRFQGENTGHWTWLQAPLPLKPSSWPHVLPYNQKVFNYSSEDPGAIPSTHKTTHNHLLTPVPEDLSPSFGCFRNCMQAVHNTHMLQNTHNNKKMNHF